MQDDPSRDLQRLWGEGSVRVFISHTAAHGWAASRIQEQLQRFGLASFVSHKDIEPMAEWELEIRRALSSAHALVALLTPDSTGSKWTDQEVGIALGLGVPVIPVRLGCDPYGFIGRYQAIPGSLTDWASVDKIASDIFAAMLETGGIDDVMKNMYVNAVRNSPSWDRSNELARFLPHIRNLSPVQTDALVEAYNTNPEVSGSYGFTGSQTHGFRGHLSEHLHRITGYDFQLIRDVNGSHQLRSVDLLFALTP